MPVNPQVTRRTVLGSLGAAGVASLAGCASSVPGFSETSSVRCAQVLPPVTLDPLRLDDLSSAQVARRVFQGLYTFDSGTDVVPQLAADQPTRNSDTSYTISLREEATFHDGAPVTAEDVRYSYETPVAEDAPSKWALEPIEEIRTPDEHTVEFRLEHPYPPFRYALTQAVVPKEVRESNPDAFATDPVGSGPYEVAQFAPGRRAVLTARDEYWGDAQPPVEEVTFVGVHSGLARSMSLRTGQNDLVERVQPKLWSVTQAMPDTRVELAESLRYFYVGFNCNAGPTADPAVRKAIDYLVDMDTLVEHFVAPKKRGDDRGSSSDESAAADGTAWRQFGPLPRDLTREWEFPVDRWREIPRRKNPEKAKRLLRAADVGSWAPKVAVPRDMLREKFADAIVHELSNIGYSRARTVTYPWPEFRKRLRAGSPSRYHMFVGSWSGWPDPDAFLYPLFHENVEGVTNFTFYQDETVMNQLRRARETDDHGTRRRLYEAAISTLLRDRVHLPAFTLHNTFGVAKDLRGFSPHPVAPVNPRFVGPDAAVSSSA